MTWGANRKSRRAFSLVEMAAVLAASGILAGTLVMLMDGMMTHFGRLRAGHLYSLHIDPLQQLLKLQVRASRCAVYAGRAGALASVFSTRIPAGTALRCDRQDGLGWFVLWWDAAEHTLWLESGAGSGGAPAGPPIPFSASLSDCRFDVSAGFLQVFASLPAPRGFLPDAPERLEYALYAESD